MEERKPLKDKKPSIVRSNPSVHQSTLLTLIEAENLSEAEKFIFKQLEDQKPLDELNAKLTRDIKLVAIVLLKYDTSEKIETLFKFINTIENRGVYLINYKIPIDKNSNLPILTGLQEFIAAENYYLAEFYLKKFSSHAKSSNLDISKHISHINDNYSDSETFLNYLNKKYHNKDSIEKIDSNHKTAFKNFIIEFGTHLTKDDLEESITALRIKIDIETPALQAPDHKLENIASAVLQNFLAHLEKNETEKALNVLATQIPTEENNKEITAFFQQKLNKNIQLVCKSLINHNKKAMVTLITSIKKYNINLIDTSDHLVAHTAFKTFLLGKNHKAALLCLKKYCKHLQTKQLPLAGYILALNALDYDGNNLVTHFITSCAEDTTTCKILKILIEANPDVLRATNSQKQPTMLAASLNKRKFVKIIFTADLTKLDEVTKTDIKTTKNRSHTTSEPSGQEKVNPLKHSDSVVKSSKKSSWRFWENEPDRSKRTTFTKTKSTERLPKIEDTEENTGSRRSYNPSLKNSREQDSE